MLTHLNLGEKLHHSLLSEALWPSSPLLIARALYTVSIQSNSTAEFPVGPSSYLANTQTNPFTVSRSGEPLRRSSTASAAVI